MTGMARILAGIPSVAEPARRAAVARGAALRGRARPSHGRTTEVAPVVFDEECPVRQIAVPDHLSEIRLRSIRPKRATLLSRNTW
jgi:hypothetical protein